MNKKPVIKPNKTNITANSKLRIAKTTTAKKISAAKKIVKKTKSGNVKADQAKTTKTVSHLAEQTSPKKPELKKTNPALETKQTKQTKNKSNTQRASNQNPNEKSKKQLYSFTSTEAFNSFWSEILGIINRSLSVEDNIKIIQKAITEKMLEIQQHGFSIPDGRLQTKDWESDPMFAQVRTWYAYNANLWESFAQALPLPDKESRRKVNFLTRQLIDLFSPANFSFSNPEFINKAIETKGESIKNGINNLLADIQKGRITHVNEDNFTLGKNLATTEGKVIYRCALFELIEYKPQSKTVSKNPILFVPPCINKFYIMDLSTNNSLVRWTVEQGQHLYLISWRNIDEETINTSWEDYVNAVIMAIGVVRKDSHSEGINILGFCVGGTILASSLAVMAAKKMKMPNSMTLLTTLLDFGEPGDLGVFLNSTLIDEMDNRLKLGGAVVPGSSLAQVFSILRPKDLIWNYVSTKYLKGETPRDFDILYWNSDSTNQSLKMMAWYLRNCYLENRLIKKTARVLGEVIDLKKITIPTYVYASREDHIVPWTSSYESAKTLGGKVRFVLGASGHIAGVINHPAANKRNYWVSGSDSTPAQDNPDEWFNSSQSITGSWWADWNNWLTKFNGGENPAAKIGYENKKSLAPAPGEFVRVRAKVDDSPMSFMMLFKKIGSLLKNKEE